MASTVLTTLGLIFAIVGAVIIGLVAPQYRATFDAFGADLPIFSRIVAYHTYFVVLLPASVLAVRFLWPRVERRPIYSFVVGLGWLLASPLVLLIAGYLPIFMLGAAI